MAHKFLALALAVVLVSVTGLYGVALAERIQQGEVVYYTVRKGDTLWDISGRFFEDQFKWPELWKRNPFIKNPHLIYPGDVLKMTPEAIEVVKRPVVVPPGLPVIKLMPPPLPPEEEEMVAPVPTEMEVVEVLPAPPSAPPAPVKKFISHLIARNGFISKEDIEESGAIIASTDEKIILGERDDVFLSFRDPDSVFKGERFTVFSVIEEVSHPVTEEPMGNLYRRLGSVRVTGLGKTIEGRIDVSYEEITAGTRVFQFEEPGKEVEVIDALSAVTGYIVVSLSGSVELGESDLVIVDRGESDGLQEGNIMKIFRERGTVQDPLDEEKTLTLPPEELGALIIIDTKEHFSTAVIFDSLNAIWSGDIVKTR